MRWNKKGRKENELLSICKLLHLSRTWQNQQNECAPSEDSDEPGYPSSLIRIFAVRMKKPWVLSYPLSAQRRLWSDWGMPRLIWVFAGRTLILLVLTCHGSSIFQGLKANLKRLYNLITEQQFARCHKQDKYKKLMFCLCFFHSVLLERKKFLMLGWNIAYEFNDSDFEVRSLWPVLLERKNDLSTGLVLPTSLMNFIEKILPNDTFSLTFVYLVWWNHFELLDGPLFINRRAKLCSAPSPPPLHTTPQHTSGPSIFILTYFAFC